MHSTTDRVIRLQGPTHLPWHAVADHCLVSSVDNFVVGLASPHLAMKVRRHFVPIRACREMGAPCALAERG